MIFDYNGEKYRKEAIGRELLLCSIQLRMSKLT